MIDIIIENDLTADKKLFDTDRVICATFDNIFKNNFKFLVFVFIKNSKIRRKKSIEVFTECYFGIK